MNSNLTQSGAGASGSRCGNLRYHRFPVAVSERPAHPTKDPMPTTHRRRPVADTTRDAQPAGLDR